MRKQLLLSSSAGVLIALSNPAYGQEGGASDGLAVSSEGGGIEEIIVSAQRREENVQRTALAIEVFESELLDERGISRPDDITKLATGVQVGGGTTPLIYIRGVGDFGVIATANPAVVTTLNGVPISRPQAIGGNFFDLERLEVLKGPQGTLYGRNATGGALNLIAATPRLGEFSGYVRASYGNFNALLGEGAVNMPIGDEAALRISAQVSDRDGYLEDGTDDDVHQSFRAQALLEPTPDITVHLRGGYIHLGGIGAGTTVIPSIPGVSAWTGSSSTAASDYYGTLAAANLQAAIAAGCTPGPGGNCPTPPALLDRPDSFDLFQDIDNWNVDAQIDYAFSAATLTVIPAYRNVRTLLSSQPQGFNYAPGGLGTEGETSEQISIETRLGNASEKLKWTAGLFFLNENQTTDFAVSTGLIQRVHVASDLESETYAIFGEGTYSINDTLRAIAGGRYTWDKRSQENLSKFAVSPTVLNNCLPPAAAPGTLCVQVAPGSVPTTSRTFKQATWKLGFEYDIADESMLFATISTGFKAGGFNQAIDPVNVSKTLSFDPETITAYTLGVRNRFLDNRLQVNLEAFYWDYRQLQLTTLIIDGMGLVALATQNAGRARVYGANVDVVARPLRNTTVRAAIEYVNSRYREFGYTQAAAFTSPGSTGCSVSPSNVPAGPLGPFVDVDCSGFDLVLAPNWSGNVSLNQTVPLDNSGELEFSTDLAFASSRTTSTSFVPNTVADAYANWGASLTYRPPTYIWSVQGFVRNITDAKVYTGGPGGTSPFVNGFVTSSIGSPRTYGMNVRVNF